LINDTATDKKKLTDQSFLSVRRDGRMPKVSETYLETRRQQVLDAAYSCFAQRGFHETTMQDIAQEAGVSYRVVYHYFDRKEDLIEEAWEASREARTVRV
jgi:AcrR family transcriptional regulator